MEVNPHVKEQAPSKFPSERKIDTVKITSLGVSSKWRISYEIDQISKFSIRKPIENSAIKRH